MSRHAPQPQRRLPADQVRARAAEVAELQQAGYTQDEIAARLGLSPAAVSLLATLQALEPAAWALAGRVPLKALWRIARLDPAAQRHVAAAAGEAPCLSTAWVAAQIAAAPPAAAPLPGDAAPGPDPRPSQAPEAAAALRAEVAALRAERDRLQQTIAHLDRALGHRRTGLEFARAVQRLVALERELEDRWLPGTLDGLALPTLERWHAALTRAADTVQAAIDRVRWGEAAGPLLDLEAGAAPTDATP